MNLTLTYRVFDTLQSFIAGAKVVLIERSPSYSGYIRKDSGYTNSYGCISFQNLVIGNSYLASASSGCWIPAPGYAVLTGPYDPEYFTDTLRLVIAPMGILKVSNPLPVPVRTWTDDLLVSQVLQPNTTADYFLFANTNTIHWQKFNPITSSIEGPRFDTSIHLSCGDTSRLPFHL